MQLTRFRHILETNYAKKMKKNVFGGRFFTIIIFFENGQKLPKSHMCQMTEAPIAPKIWNSDSFFMTNWSKKGINSATENQGSKKNLQKK